jgi:hypothetical protein
MQRSNSSKGATAELARACEAVAPSKLGYCGQPPRDTGGACVRALLARSLAVAALQSAGCRCVARCADEGLTVMCRLGPFPGPSRASGSRCCSWGFGRSRGRALSAGGAA